MDTAKSPRTTRDALTLEMLGDIGRCDDKITALENKIDALPEALERAMAPTLGALVKASKEAQATIGQLGTAEKATFGNFAAACPSEEPPLFSFRTPANAIFSGRSLICCSRIAMHFMTGIPASIMVAN